MLGTGPRIYLMSCSSLQFATVFILSHQCLSVLHINRAPLTPRGTVDFVYLRYMTLTPLS